METVSSEDRIEDPPRKRLLANTNPNVNFANESPESTVSSDSSSDRFVKKTRELPNLSDCHGCGLRINYTNPRERLQLMESMWRIVLLCKKCSKRVNSSKLCTYCFSAVVDENDCFKCCDCLRCIHKECVARYGLSLGVSVCGDCWIPGGFGSLIRARKRKFRVRNNECCEQANALLESRVLVGATSKPKLLVDEVGRKVASVAIASENAQRKAEAAKNAVEFAQGELSAVASGNVVGGCEAKVVDDSQLASLLRSAIKSSLRISKYAFVRSSFRRDDASITCYSRRHASKKIILMNSSTLNAPLICYSRRGRKACFRNSASSNAPLMCYSRRRFGRKAFSHDRECECVICNTSENTDEHVSTSLADLRACILGSSSVNSFSGNNCQEDDGERISMKPHNFLLTYYRVGRGTSRPSVFVKNSDCSYMDSANMYTEGMTDSRNFSNGNDEICEKSDHYTDRFLLKYKRISRSKPEFSF